MSTNGYHHQRGGSPSVGGGSFDMTDEDYNDPTAYFEKGRIKQLQDERVVIQKKTFTKWCNSFLLRARMEIVDLFTDVSDGVVLMKLLEIISGDKLGKPNRGRMRVHKIENLNRVLDFLKRKRIQLENIGAEDILDRNERLILGLIWTIILRFQIDEIEIDVDEEEMTGERKRAKDALLLWCQRKTTGYPGVKIDNFSTSWRSGLGFNALIHAHRPDLINYQGLNPQNHIENLNNAFDSAEKRLGIPRLLDAEDVDVNRPDDKSIITYVSMYYHYFAKQKSELTGAKRIAKIIGNLMSTEQVIDDYEQLSTDILTWISRKIKELNDRKLPNSLKGIQEQMMKFKHYRTVEKPPKYKEKGELEALFFTIQTKRKAMGQKTYIPPEGMLLHDIETAWEYLDRAEHARQVALNEELLRQERLDQLARKFERKAKLRESWLREMTAVLQDFDFGKTAAQVEASVKKHEAISADVLPREDRFKNLSTMAAELQKEHYYDSEKVRARERDISEKWAYLLQALERRRRALMSLNDLMTMLRDIDTLSTEFQQLEPSVKSRDLGKHIMGVEDLLQKHNLTEAQIAAQGEWLKNILTQAQNYIRNKGEQHEILQRKTADLQRQYETLLDLSKSRRNALERARELYQFIQDHEEEEGWIAEKYRVCANMLSNRDLGATPQLKRLYKSMETEMQGHWQRSKQVLSTGEKLLSVVPPTAKDEVQTRIGSLQENWDKLRHILSVLGRWLKEAQQASQYFQDANEAESWMREKMPLVCSDDFGKDEISAESLLSRHSRLEEEIKAYKMAIEQLDEMANELATVEFLSAVVMKETGEEGDTVVEERVVPQVKALYRYDGHGLHITKGEILTLVQKTNNDWWRVVKDDGNEGFVPANYVKETEGRTVKVEVSKKLERDEASPSKLRAKGDSEGEKENAILERQKHINSTYRRLNKLGQARRRYLEDAIKLYRFYRECDEFEVWAKETEILLHEDPSAEHVEAARRKFDNLMTDIVANGGTRLKGINSMADELISAGHSQQEHIKRRQSEINDMWTTLLKQRDLAKQSLETSESVSAFNQTCDETRAWMNDKFDLLGQDSEAKDLKALQALQRRHQNLEREMKPLEEKMRHLAELAEQVKHAYPSQTDAINRTLTELQRMWADLKKKAAERRRLLEETQGQQMFQNAVKDLLNWTEKTKDQLADTQKPIDVASAEDLLKKHYDLRDDIKAHDDEFEYVKNFGKRLLAKSPGLKDVQDTVAHVTAEQETLNAMWNDVENLLKVMLELQLFNREADYIDAATKGHDAFLDLADLGDSVDAVENLRKRHADFEAKLHAQAERLIAFNETANSLIEEKHPESRYINERRAEVLERRNSVREKARERRNQLKAALDFHSFKRDTEELSIWIDEKMKVACDESYKDGTNLDRKLQKHEAFEAELKANADRLDNLNEEGQELIKLQHYASPEVKVILTNLNDQWRRLASKTEEKGEKLRQACDQKSLNRTLDDAHLKLNEMERALASKDLGSDLRGVKVLIGKHSQLEQEMTMYNKRIRAVVSEGEAMAQKGHFDSNRILQNVQEFTKRFESLQDPAARRRAQLEESRKRHQFIFDVDCELQWISEKRPIASSKNCGNSLTDATNLHKKHEKLESEVSGHQPIIDQTLAKGDDLVNANHSAADQIKEKSAELGNAWRELCQLVKERRSALDLALKGQQFLFDAAEMETYIGEKRSLLSSEDYGQDEDAADKLLKKHKALQDDMNAYRGLLENVGKNCARLTQLRHPECERFEQKQRELEDQFAGLQALADKRRQHLEDAVCLYQYLRESQELEAWINEQLQVAMSDEYGQDYEHLTELVAKFDDFKQGVKTGSERFIMCEEAAKTFLERDPPFKKDVLQRQEQLRSAWSLLLDYIENRDQKLEAAEEIHRFNRDAADALSRTQEKSAAIPSDLGRDMNTVQSLLRKHEAFENELAALEAQLQILLEDSARLQQAYPGGNAEHIAGQQQVLVEAWNGLQEKAIQRRDDLNAAYDLQRFLATARDLVGWTQEVISEMQTERHVRDLPGAELLQTEHARLKAEMQARNEDLVSLADMADQMIQAEHYAKQEIADRISQVEEARDSMFSEWDLREEFLKQLVEWHSFQNNAKQLLANITTHEASLKSSDIGGSTEQVEAQIRKHETFGKILSALEERVNSLNNQGQGLIGKKHMESPNIDQLSNEVTHRYKGLRKLAQEREKALQEALLFARFNGDVAEAEGWVDERRKKIATEAEQQGQLASLQDKMKRLQKHQAFEAELSANETIIKQIETRGEELLQKKHVEGSGISQKKENLLSKWRELVAASQDQSAALAEARDLLNFNQLVERVMAWIREKELMISANHMGKDYEHCTALRKKLDDSEGESVVDDQTVQKLNQLGEKLVKQGRSDKKNVQSQLDDMNKKWRALQISLTDYRRKLNAALEVHSFNRDVDDTNERIGEKAVLLSSEDFGKDLTTVESLLRKQDEIERDMTAIHEKLRSHDAQAQELLAKEPPLQETIYESLKKLEESWDRLTQLANERRARLQNAHTLQKFFDAVKKTEMWANNIRNKMASYASPNSVPEAQALLDSHREKLAEIQGRQENITGLREYGHKLSQEQPSHKTEINRAGKKLITLEQEVKQVWDREDSRLLRYYHLQMYKDSVGVAESWLSSKEAFLAQEELGDSLDTVASLLKKHDGFVKTVHAQSEKIDQLKADANELAEKDEENAAEICQRKDAVAQRHSSLLNQCTKRQKLLEDSKQWHLYLKTCHELMTWLNAKLQIAYDESYLDPTNLQSKLQKHQAFDAELRANQGRIDGVLKEGEDLIARDHFNKEQIGLQLREINNGWKELVDKSTLKTERLREAYAAHQFNRKLDDLDRWLDKVEHQLASEDHGKDFTSVENLIKKHDTLEQEISSRDPQVQEAKSLAAQFVKTNHFMATEVKQKADTVADRFHSLKEPCQIRRDNLKEAQLLYQWLREADEQIGWVRDKLPQVGSTNFGDSLQGAQSLHKKHQVLEQEFTAREPAIAKVREHGEKMVQNDHFASRDISERLNELLAGITNLRNQSEGRKRRLKDSVESQQFYSEANEAEQYMRERSPLVASGETGKDDDTVQSLLRKLDTVEKDIDQYRSEIDRLAKSAQIMIERDHFDSAQIAVKQGKLEKDYADLSKQCQIRRTQLVDAGRYHGYLRQADDLIAWLKDKETAANSEDYGRDLEDCQGLIHSFEQLVRELAAAGERVAAVQRQQEDLLRSGHPFSASIKAKGSDLQALWGDVNEAATERQQALQGAKQVHKFDQEADETLNWLQEKEATQVIAEQEDLSQADLVTIKTLLQRHDEFMRGVSAVEKQVRDLCREAERLESTFPDTRDHLEVRRQEMEEQLKDVNQAANQRHQKLLQAEQLQAYFQEYREYLAWIQSMQTTVTMESLPRDVPGCEALMLRHQEYNTEIKAREPQIEEFNRMGREMIRQGHLLSPEIQEKVEDLQSSYGNLKLVWKERKALYDENLDAQMWKRDAALLEAWLVERENYLGEDWRQADSVTAVEDLIREYDDFLTTLQAQGDKFEALKKLTLLEEAFSNQREKETERRKVEEQKKDRQKKDQIKTLEKQKILQERKQERERRKTQEISFFKPQTGDEIPVPAARRQTSDPKMSSTGLSLAVAGGSEQRETLVPTQKGPAPKSPTTPSPSKPMVPPKPVFNKETPNQHVLNYEAQEGLTVPGSGRDTGGIRKVQSFRELQAGQSRTPKTPKRTPTFTTRRPNSLKKVRPVEELAEIDMSGYLERKQEFQSGGKKATIRSWKQYYTILCGQLLCFFKDEESFMENSAANPPVYILGAQCDPYPDYHKRKHSFRVRTADGAEYLFSAGTEHQLNEWVQKITFHANLPPSLQLKSYDDGPSPSGRPIASSSSVPLPPIHGGRPEFSVDVDVDSERQRRMSNKEDSGFLGSPKQSASPDSSGEEAVRMNGNGFHSAERDNRLTDDSFDSPGPEIPKRPPPLSQPTPGFLASSAPPPRTPTKGGTGDSADFMAWTESSGPHQHSNSPEPMDGDKGAKKRHSRGFGSLFKSSKKKESSH